MKFKYFLLSLALSCFAHNAFADWHSGKMVQLNVGYDGVTVSFRLEGWSRNNCTCYSAWPTYMCLDQTRQTHDFEKAMLLAAKARGSVLNAYIDEVTCRVTALYEIN